MPILEEHITPLRTILAAFSVSSFAGLVAHLREGKPWKWVDGITSALSSGCLGAAVTMIWYRRFQDNIYFLIGVVLLACLGGRPTVDAVTTEIPAIIKRLIARWAGVKSSEDHHVPDPVQPSHETRDLK